MIKSKVKQYIHNYDAQFNASIIRLKESSALDVNKKLILDFEQKCFVKENIALPTRENFA